MEKTPLSGSSRRRLPERNPQTHAAHRRQVFWQITLPLALVVLVFLGLGVAVGWSAVAGSGQVSRWADVALIWQLPLPILLAFLCTLVNIGVVYGVTKLIGVIPGLARLAHEYVLVVQVKVNQITDRLVGPIVKLDSQRAGLKSGFRALRRK